VQGGGTELELELSQEESVQGGGTELPQEEPLQDELELTEGT